MAKHHQANTTTPTTPTTTPPPPHEKKHPTDTITRAMGVWMLWEHAGRPDITGLPNIFADVADGVWYDAPLRWAAANGIVLGTGGGHFAPHDDLTHRHWSLMLARYAITFGLSKEIKNVRHINVSDGRTLVTYKERLLGFYLAEDDH